MIEGKKINVRSCVRFSTGAGDRTVAGTYVRLNMSDSRLRVRMVDRNDGKFFKVKDGPTMVGIHGVRPISRRRRVGRVMRAIGLSSFGRRTRIRRRGGARTVGPMGGRVGRPGTISRGPERPGPMGRETTGRGRPERFERPGRGRIERGATGPMGPTGPIRVLASPRRVGRMRGETGMFLHSMFTSVGLKRMRVASRCGAASKDLRISFRNRSVKVLVNGENRALSSLRCLADLIMGGNGSGCVHMGLSARSCHGHHGRALRGLTENVTCGMEGAHGPIVLRPVGPCREEVVRSTLRKGGFIRAIDRNRRPCHRMIMGLGEGWWCSYFVTSVGGRYCSE